MAHQKLGEILRQIGRADDARRQLDRSLRLAEGLAATNPSDLAVAECLRDTYLAIGELILRDELAREAAGYFRRALEHAEAIVAAQPGRAGASLGLAEAYHRLGRAFDASGEWADAEACFRTMHELAGRWAEAVPGDAAARDLLASSYVRLARVRRHYHDHAAAGEAYRQAIAIARPLWQEKPKDLTHKTHLALALLDSAILEIERRAYAAARPPIAEAERLYVELAEADPEDREAQVWLVHARYHFGRLERDEEHFGPASQLFRQALDHLERLDREGKLEGRPAFKYRHMRVLKQDVAFCSAAPHVLEDPSVALSQPPHVTVNLLRLRAKKLAERGRDAELVATVESLCAIDDGDWEDRYALARAIATCVPYFDGGRSASLSPALRSELRRRCIDRAVAALARSIDLGFQDASRLELQSELDSIRESPAFQAEVERAKKQQAPLEVRIPSASDRAAGSTRSFSRSCAGVGAGRSRRDVMRISEGRGLSQYIALMLKLK